MFRSHFLTFASLLYLGLCIALTPSTQAQSPSGADTPPSVTASYRLGPGDVISIEVTNYPELTSAPVTIRPDGKLTVQFVDSLPVIGMTTTELVQTLTQRWSEYVIKPSVNVTLVQKREEHGEINIVGAVVKPGSYSCKSQMTVLDALAAAGGLRDDADLAHVQLIRQGKASDLDLNALLNKGELPNNVPLLPGDVLLIPELHNRVYVAGAVVRRGYYNFQYGDRLLDALSNAGIIVGTSDLTKVQLVYYDKFKNIMTEQTVNFSRFYSKGDTSVNLLLSPGDAIFIPVKKITPMLIGPGDFGDNGKPLFLGL